MRSGFVLLFFLYVFNEAFLADAAEPDTKGLKGIVAYLFEVVWNEADFSGIDTVWSENVLFHFRGSSEVVSPTGLKEMVISWHTAFPDFRFKVHQVVVEGDTAAVRVSLTGTQTGVFGELLPTNRSVDVTEMMFFRF